VRKHKNEVAHSATDTRSNHPYGFCLTQRQGQACQLKTSRASPLLPSIHGVSGWINIDDVLIMCGIIRRSGLARELLNARYF